MLQLIAVKLIELGVHGRDDVANPLGAQSVVTLALEYRVRSQQQYSRRSVRALFRINIGLLAVRSDDRKPARITHPPSVNFLTLAVDVVTPALVQGFYRLPRPE